MLRRIIGKTVTTFIKDDIINAVGPVQLSAGQEGGCESTVHALNKMFEEEDREAVLLVDATNAYNSLNRATSLLNIQQICPEFAVLIINTYREPAKLYLPGGKHILFNEGTTQGDNCASGFYSLSILPILKELACIACKQIWYADDAAAAGLLKLLKLWWDSIFLSRRAKNNKLVRLGREQLFLMALQWELSRTFRTIQIMYVDEQQNFLSYQ